MFRKYLPCALALLIGLLSFSCADDALDAYGMIGDQRLAVNSKVPFLLYQNYPNPFNPTTSIRFDVAYQMHVRITVVTVDFVEVATIFDSDVEYGPNEVEFRAPDDFPSGEYYYIMTGEGVTEIRKMKLVK